MSAIGIIFDWDGVIIDSAAPHERSWERLAEAEGLCLPEDHFQRGFGMKNDRIIPEILGWADQPVEIQRLADRKEVLYREMVVASGLQPLPGVRTLLEQLAASGMPCAIGSSTCRANIDCLLELLALESFFSAIVSGEEVKHGKPAPDVFLLAAERLGQRPACCVVFEDAPVGIAAAKIAGMIAIGVTTGHSREALGEADHVVSRLDEIEMADLERMVLFG